MVSGTGNGTFQAPFHKATHRSRGHKERLGTFMKQFRLSVRLFFILIAATPLPGCATVYSGVAHTQFIEKQKAIRTITVLPVVTNFQEKQGNGTEIPLYENMKTAHKVSEEEIGEIFKTKGYEIHFFKPSEQETESEEWKKTAAFYDEKLDKVFDRKTEKDASVGWPVPSIVTQSLSADAYIYVRAVGYTKAQDARMAEAITQGVISGVFAVLTGYSSYTPMDPSCALMVRTVLLDPSGDVLWHAESPSLHDPRNEQNMRTGIKVLYAGFPSSSAADVQK